MIARLDHRLSAGERLVLTAAVFLAVFAAGLFAETLRWGFVVGLGVGWLLRGLDAWARVRGG